MASLLADIRFALRSWRKVPTFLVDARQPGQGRPVLRMERARINERRWPAFARTAFDSGAQSWPFSPEGGQAFGRRALRP